ncbi:hypothetical protein OH799_07115 [Nocardia sp. NBC_00881]|uniref:hypothetical protein n=1 Tax=Nocardia sp. NBC_00881 TaxID=2975995 RepID=UPI00386EC281|nr:hypothetical protein OH799_07115 [Nocardia sp. NBC_00881]
MRFVKEHPQQPVELVLRVLGIASSTYYGWVERARNPSSWRLQDEQLLAEIVDIQITASTAQSITEATLRRRGGCPRLALP